MLSSKQSVHWLQSSALSVSDSGSRVLFFRSSSCCLCVCVFFLLHASRHLAQFQLTEPRSVIVSKLSLVLACRKIDTVRGTTPQIEHIECSLGVAALADDGDNEKVGGGSSGSRRGGERRRRICREEKKTSPLNRPPESGARVPLVPSLSSQPPVLIRRLLTTFTVELHSHAGTLHREALMLHRDLLW